MKEEPKGKQSRPDGFIRGGQTRQVDLGYIIFQHTPFNQVIATGVNSS